MSRPKEWDLKTLLSYCQARQDENYERAWREFIRRFREPLYGHVYYSCRAWRVSRLNRQLSESVDDIMAEVLVILMRSIKNFRAVDQPAMFQSWLAVIAYRATGRYVKRYFSQQILNDEVRELPELKTHIDPHYRRQLYEYIVDHLRAAIGKPTANSERDIHIFMLTAWWDFSEKMLKRHPAFPELKSPYAVKSILKRMREKLRKLEI